VEAIAELLLWSKTKGTMSNRHPAQCFLEKSMTCWATWHTGMEKAPTTCFPVSMKTVIGAASWKPISTLESELHAIHTLLGTGIGPHGACVPEIIRHQNDDGGWPIYGNGPSNISASVKAYFALS